MVRTSRFFRISLPVIVSLLIAVNSRAGQVVTSDIREWSKKAVAEETSHPAVAAPNTVAVLYFLNKTGERDLDPLQKGLTLLLISDLSAVKELQVVERVRLQALVEEVGLGESGLVAPTSAPRTGKLLAARRLVGGDYSGDASKLLVQSRVLDVPTGKLLGQPAASDKLSELYRIEKELLFAIVKFLKVEVTPEEQVRLRKPCSTNTRALFALFRGVDASDRGNYDQAADFYQQALDIDPDICIAGDALDELENLGLVVLKNKTTELLQSLRDSTSLTNQLTPKDELRYEFTPKDVPATTSIVVVFPTAAAGKSGSHR